MTKTEAQEVLHAIHVDLARTDVASVQSYLKMITAALLAIATELVESRKEGGNGKA